MRLIVIVIVLCILLPVTGFAQYTFEKIYNTSELAIGSSVTQCHDGGYAIAGTYLNPTSENLLLRTNSKGEVLWANKYWIQGVEHCETVLQTKDNGFLLSGWSTIARGLTVVKVDSLGVYQWSAAYSKDQTAGRFGTATLEVDNGYVILGTFEEDKTKRVFAVKIDLIGGIKWSTVLYNDNINEINYAMLTSDSSIVAVGQSKSSLSGSDLLLLKLDTRGNVKWVHNYNMDQDELGESVVEKDNGEYHILGTYHSTGAIQKMLYLIVDKDGNLEDVKGIMDGTGSGAVRILGTDPNTSFILGSSVTDNALLYAIDRKGNHLWSRIYSHGTLGGFGPVGSTAAEITDDGGFIITGWNRQGSQYSSVSLIKTDRLGITECSDTGKRLTPWNIQIEKLAYAYTDSDHVIQGGYPQAIDPLVFEDSTLCFTAPSISANFSFTEICEGESVVFSNKTISSLNSNYIWNFGDGKTSAEENPIHLYENPGLYEVSLLAYNEYVKDSVKRQVQVYANPFIKITHDSLVVCEDENFKLHYQATGASKYEWYSNDPSSLISKADRVALPAINATYFLEAISDEGCKSDTTFNVQTLLAPSPPIQVSYTEGNCYPLDIELNALALEGPGLDSLLINISDGYQIKDPNLPLQHVFAHQPDSSYPAQYRIFVEAYYNNGCKSEMIEKVAVCEELHIPNVFSPNGDGANDVFELKGLDESNCEINIFDRYGIMVFEEKNYQSNWNGRDKNGRTLAPDVYYYILKCDGITHTAWVKIMR